MASKARDLSNFISTAAIDASEIGTGAITTDKIADTTITHAKLHTTMDLSGKTVTLPTINALDVTNNINVGGTVDGVDIATRDAILTSTTTTAGAALPKAGGAMTGNITGLTALDVTGTVTADGLVVDSSGALTTFVEFKNSTGSGKWDIKQGGSNNTLIRGYNSSNTETIRLDPTSGETFFNGGNVGIGTSSPATKLHVSGGSDNIRLDNTGSGNYGLEILRNGTKSASFAWGEGNANLEIKNYRNDSQADGPYANIDFFTGGTNATSPNFNPDLRMRIQQTGDVGIGTSNPFSKLHINSNGAPATSGNMTTGLTVSNSSGGTAINIGTYDAGGYSYIQSAYVNNAGVARDLGFRIGDTEMLRLNSSSLSLYKKNYGTSSSVVHSGHLTRFRWATQANDTWRTICSLNDFHGRIFVSASDASSGDRAEWSVRTTSPAYGVSSFTQIYYHNGGWNTGSFDLQYTTISGTYYLQGKASSYYSTSNNFQFDIEFNKSQ